MHSYYSAAYRSVRIKRSCKSRYPYVAPNMILRDFCLAFFHLLRRKKKHFIAKPVVKFVFHFNGIDDKFYEHRIARFMTLRDRKSQNARRKMLGQRVGQ